MKPPWGVSVALRRAFVWAAGIAGVWVSGWAAGSGLSQQDPWVAETIPDVVLQTQSLQGPLQGWDASVPFQFELGFSTPESLTPGEFADSLTLSLSRTGISGAVPFVTLDPYGLTLQQGVLQNLIPGATFSVREVPYSQLGAPGAVTTVAYSLQFQLPTDFPREGLGLTLDLFSNNNPISSRGYGFIVPEPASTALVGLGGGILLVRAWVRRRCL